MEVALASVSEVAKILVGPIHRKISYVFKYQSYVEELSQVLMMLKNEKEDVRSAVDYAMRKGEEVYEDVKCWLSHVDRFTENVEAILADEGEAKKHCFLGLCPNLFKRYNLGKQAGKAARDGSDLLAKGNFNTTSYTPAPEQTETLHLRGYEQFESRMSTFRGIMEALKDDNINVIGVCGMAGVGKTTLVKQVARQLMEDKLFDEVVMVVVSQNPDYKAIQNEIAGALGLFLGEHEDVSERAHLLRQRLKASRVLVILDDVWNRLDLEAVGIPYKSYENEIKDDRRRCAMLLTSRSTDLLYKMNSQKNFLINVLYDQEAVQLFEKMAGVFEGPLDFQNLAIKIAQECGGLPVAITTVATALRNKSLFVWKDALLQLRRSSNHRDISGLASSVYSSVKLSYNFLKSQEAQSLFLLCSLLNDGSRIPIDDLLRCAMGLDLLSDVFSLEEARSRMHRLIDDLKASCLLLDGDNKDDVKMHDIVREIAVLTARDRLMFNIQNVADLKEVLEDLMQKDPIAISLPCRDIQELPERLECPKLKLFFLLSEKLSLVIPDLFFEGVPSLQVLSLNGFHFPSLPSTLGWLINLQTLSFECCILGDVATVGVLKKLVILSFRNSHIEQLPEQIGQLTRLKLLDLSNCSKLKSIRPNVISSLPRLEELYMGNSFTHWDVEGQNNASLAELNQLSRLTTLEMHILDAQVMPQELFAVGLERYKIFLGDVWSWTGKYETSRTKYETSRTLKLKLDNRMYFEHGIKMLLRRTEDLHLDKLNGFQNVLHELDGEGFPRLKHLLVQNASEILYIVSSVEGAACNAFPLLESLSLHNLINLEKLCHGQLTEDCSFRSLSIVKVQNCGKLKHLFSFSIAKNLLNLQEIEVTDCENLEMLVGVESEKHVPANESVRRINFTQLHSLALRKVPKLTSLGLNLETATTTSEIAGDDDCDEALFNDKVIFPCLEKLELVSTNIKKIWPDCFLATSGCQNLTNLIVDCCGGLKFLFSSSMLNSLVQLIELKIRDCLSMEGVVNDTGLSQEAKMTEMVFPSLVFLELNGLPKLRRFGTGNSVQFPSLVKLFIDDCPNLEDSSLVVNVHK